MEEKPTSRLEACFEGLSDPRIERTKLHKLIDIVMIAICAVICGADDWVEVAMFGEAFVQNLRRSQDWPQLHELIQVRSERHIKNEVEKHDRYFISNLDWTAEQFLTAVRSHWTIENCLHWVLDIAFQEDHHRLRKDHGPENFAMLRHVAGNLLKQEHSVRAGIKAKRLKTGWDESYLLKLLTLPY